MARRIALFYSRLQQWGGAERVLLAMASSLVNDGNEVHIFSANARMEYRERVSSVGAELHSARSVKTGEYVPSVILDAWRTAQLVEGAWDAWIYCNYPGSLMAHAAARRKGVTCRALYWMCFEPPYTLHQDSRSSIFGRRAKNPLRERAARVALTTLGGPLRSLDREVVSKTDVALVQSENVRREVLRVYGETASNLRFEMLFPPIDLGKDFVPPTIAPAVRPAPEAFTFLSFGRLAHQPKRVDITIRAFARVYARHPQSRLIIGGTGPEARALQRLASELGVSEGVQFVGFVPDEDLPSLYASADVFVYSGVNEPNGPLTVLEAMAYGVPVVATGAGGTVEVLNHGETGLLFPPGDDEALASAMDRLMTAPDLRLQLAAAAQPHAVENYSLPRFVKIFTRALSRTL